MLIRLNPEQLSDYWQVINLSLRSSAVALADMSEDRINNVIAALVKGKAMCWVDERDNKVTTVVITTVVEESISKTFNMLIYCIHLLSKLKSTDYIEMARGLGSYAKSIGCAQVMLYCSNPKLTEILKDSGADSVFSLVTFPLL